MFQTDNTDDRAETSRSEDEAHGGSDSGDSGCNGPQPDHTGRERAQRGIGPVRPSAEDFE